MPQGFAGVLKKSAVKMAGSRRLDSAAAQDATGMDRTTAQAAPQARIIQQKDGQAVVEVVCACGQRMQLVCMYEPPK